MQESETQKNHLFEIESDLHIAKEHNQQLETQLAEHRLQLEEQQQKRLDDVQKIAQINQVI